MPPTPRADLPDWLAPALVDPEEALRRAVRSGTTIGSGLATSEPTAFYAGLLDHVRRHDVHDLEIRQGLFTAPHPILVGDALDAPRPALPGPISGLGDAVGDALALRRLNAHLDWLADRRIRFTSAFLGPVFQRVVPDTVVTRRLAPRLAGRNRVTSGDVRYHPVHFPHAGATLARGRDGGLAVDTFAVPATLPDDRGRLSLGLANGVAGDVLPLLLADDDAVLVLEMNRRMPWVEGPGHVLGQDALGRLVRQGRLLAYEVDVEPPGLPPGTFADPDEVETAIARHLVDDVVAHLGDTRGRALQVGIGRISAQAVRMLGESPWTGRGYTEMLDPLTYDLLDDGTIAGTHLLDEDGHRVEMDGLACTFAMGEQGSDFPDRLDGDARVTMTGAARLLQPRAFHGGMGVNNVLGIDLAGNVNATGRDHIPFSAVGGLATIMRGLAHDGVAYLCLKSTHRGPDGRARSSIFPGLEPGTPVTLGLPDLLGTDGGRIVLVTEHGATRLDGQPHDAFVRGLIDVADPEHRDELAATAWERYRIRV